ncbi:MAG: metal ABC transporter ATP-binding protein [Patescibacteria group bacterium]|jgi:ABC-type Mn2+/Zn2+ transport system ATPase subunit
MNDKPKILEMEKVSVTLGGAVIVNNISAVVEQGEVLAIIGPNGAGKTTLVKAILGFLPFTGRIRLFGQGPQKSLQRVGYVPQRFSFDKSFPITVREFIRFSMHQKDPKRLEHSLWEVEMVSHQDKLLGDLSGGQLQRVLIARALVNKPEILFLDEPTAGIDLGGEKDFYQIMQHQNIKHHLTIIMISHEVNMVYTYATQVLCLNKDLFCFGRPKEAITQEVLKQLYSERVKITPHHHSQ